jgi:hypothetical protein
MSEVVNDEQLLLRTGGLSIGSRPSPVLDKASSSLAANFDVSIVNCNHKIDLVKLFCTPFPYNAQHKSVEYVRILADIVRKVAPLCQ